MWGIFYWGKITLLTVSSSESSYASPQEMMIRYDKRLIGRLISDNNVPVTNDADIVGSDILNTLLKEASAIVESYVYKGGRYTAEDLKSLYESEHIGRELLVSLVCSLTLYLLWRRRGDPSIEIPKDFAVAEQYLRRLERGENIFAFDETMTAGRRMESFGNPVIMMNNYHALNLIRLTGNVPFLGSPFFTMRIR